jgi:hypothetical protein
VINYKNQEKLKKQGRTVCGGANHIFDDKPPLGVSILFFSFGNVPKPFLNYTPLSM